MKIEVKNCHKEKAVNSEKIKKTVRRILELEGQPHAEVSILFVDDKRMRQLNSAFRGADSTTDVLAFSMREGVCFGVNPHLLGDVVICVDAARRYVRCHGGTISQEINLYLIHGILHLLGYTDEGAKGKKKMRQREKEVLRNVIQDKK